jgi:DNA-binding NarL/FixJ family response regulator
MNTDGHGLAANSGLQQQMKEALYPSLMKKVSRLKRRRQIVDGVWAGKGTKEIAAELGISPKTVEYHRAQLYRVLGVNDPVSLCRRAMMLGLIKPDACCRRQTVRKKD